MTSYPTLLRYFGYFFKLQNQYPFGYILDCRIRVLIGAFKRALIDALEKGGFGVDFHILT